MQLSVLFVFVLNFVSKRGAPRFVQTLTEPLRTLRIVISLMYHTLELVQPFTCISFDLPSDAAVYGGVIIPFHR